LAHVPEETGLPVRSADCDAPAPLLLDDRPTMSAADEGSSKRGSKILFIFGLLINSPKVIMIPFSGKKTQM
jgi:hypothetical protein